MNNSTPSKPFAYQQAHRRISKSAYLLIITLAHLLIGSSVFAQSPEKMSYQSVVRNSANALLVNTQVGMRISILQGSAEGSQVYTETQTPTTNANGLLSIEIGGGTGFAAINWANGPYFIKTEIDPTGGTNYTISGTTQLLSVPYALHAKTAETVIGPGTKIIAGNNVTISGKGTEEDPYVVNASAQNNLVQPTIVTGEATNLSSNGVTLSGVVSNVIGKQILEKGFVLSSVPNPNYESIKVSVGGEIGNINITIVPYLLLSSILKSNTVYYVRAYAVTENNITTYGNEISFRTLAVGQAGPAGGIVFYDKGVYSDGWRYLEAAPSDQSEGAPWGCVDMMVGNTSNEIGTGLANTNSIVAFCTVEGIAAKICNDFTFGGQSDWFLPSVNELSLMYDNLKKVGLGNFRDSWYYSSTEYYSSDAWCVFFDNNSPTSNHYSKMGQCRVRAIRAF